MKKGEKGIDIIFYLSIIICMLVSAPVDMWDGCRFIGFFY